MKRRCPEPVATYRVETIARAHRSRCTCGWQSKFFPTEDDAVDAWGAHQARRAADRGEDAGAPPALRRRRADRSRT